MNSFYSNEELKQMGFKKIGKNVLISRKASIYGASNMVIGNNVRIDDYCILSGKIEIGNYVHISAAVLMYGGDKGIFINDYSGISSRSAVYAISDDYSGNYMTNPMVPEEYRNVIGGPIFIEKHALIGSGCTIFPNLTIGEGAAVGSMSLINKSLEPYSIYVGIPAKKIKDRSKQVLEYEKMMRLEKK